MALLLQLRYNVRPPLTLRLASDAPENRVIPASRKVGPDEDSDPLLPMRCDESGRWVVCSGQSLRPMAPRAGRRGICCWYSTTLAMTGWGTADPASRYALCWSCGRPSTMAGRPSSFGFHLGTLVMNCTTSAATFVTSRAIARRLFAALLVLAPLATAAGQSTIGEMRRQATRSELEKAAKAAESAALSAPDEKVRNKLRADAAALQARLTNGDFIPGDRIMLEVVGGDTALSDTFTVRGDRMLPLPNIPPISLQGVLDSELESHLTKELERFIKEVSLTATPLVRISLIGFPQSNFFTVPVDQSITDVIATAGGYGSISTSAVDKIVVRRAGREVMDAKSTAEAIRLGKTVGDMAMRDGDELYLPDRASSTFNWQTALGAVSAITGIYFLLRYGRGRP